MRRHGSAFFQQQHAIQRAEERYGLQLRHADLERIARTIAGGRGQHVRGEEWRVHYRGRELRVVYRQETDAIVTFLPPT